MGHFNFTADYQKTIRFMLIFIIKHVSIWNFTKNFVKEIGEIKFSSNLAIQFPTKSILTPFGLQRDHPPAWELNSSRKPFNGRNFFIYKASNSFFNLSNLYKLFKNLDSFSIRTFNRHLSRFFAHNRKKNLVFYFVLGTLRRRLSSLEFLTARPSGSTKMEPIIIFPILVEFLILIKTVRVLQGKIIFFYKIRLFTRNYFQTTVTG